MDDKTQKERLEQELRFLKESFEAEVISKEEFDKGSDRIEKKLNDIKQSDKKEDTEAKKEEIKEKKEQEQKTGQPAEKKEEPGDKSTEAKAAEAIKLPVQDGGQYFEQEAAEKKEPAEIKKESKTEKEGSKVFKYGVVFVLLLLIVFFSYSFIKENKKMEAKPKQKELTKIPVQKTNVLVLNDRKSCFNCDPQRILAILESWFGELDAREIGYGTEQGKKLAENLEAKLLPVYILDGNITKNRNFRQFENLFVKKGANYILSEDAAAPALYFKRENIPNKLDLFVKPGDDTSIKAEKNLKEFLESFSEAKFEKHLSGDKLTEELGIRTFPSFLINNRVKFGGVHTPETIKENFCRLNMMAACGKSLSIKLV